MKRITTVITILLTVGQTAYCQLTTGDTAKIDSIANKLYKEGKNNGGLLIAEGNEIVYEGAFGLADRRLKLPNSPHMRFWDASIGKMFTAVLILQLVEEGKVQLEDPISKHIPWFKHELADSITIHHLLCHRSGFDSEVYSERDKAQHNEKSQRSILEHKVSEVDLAFEPGNAYLYSNGGYVLLSEVVMAYRGNDYNEILQEWIFRPLEMNETYWSESRYGPNSPIYYRSNGEEILPVIEIDYTGPGGEKTTLRDLHKFMLAVGTDTLLSKASWDLAFQPYSLPEEALRYKWGPHKYPYGYGFNLAELPYTNSETDATVSHGGAGTGTSSYTLRFLEKDRVVVLWNNKFLDPMPLELYEALAELSSK